jgi:hypothetical protein
VLVYGDHSELADPRDRLSAIAARLEQIPAMPPGIGRHAQIVAALIDAGQLQQGVEDAGFGVGELQTFVHALAGAVVKSWDSGFADFGELPDMPAGDLPDEVDLRLPEGFAFYALYPEAYADAARKLRLSAPARVIGIRSIGTTLGAMVAAALGSPPAISVRPFGDPFARHVELPLGILDGDYHYVIVDEGPGLSGSSFGSVADWLEHCGVPRERIAFMPSHSGDPGSQASLAHRRRWDEAQRVAAEFDPSILLHAFSPLDEFNTGSAFERRKFIGRSNGARVLLKFGGVGSIGERKLEMARALHAAGMTPEALGFVHGFIVERWHDDAQPLGRDEKPLEEIGRYIGARARLFPAGDASGASIEELLTMCRRNIALAIGEDAASTIEKWDAHALGKRVQRIRTDNKLDRLEWLRLGDGRLLKTDALDHHQGHDLIGCQSVEWDVAGAMVEFGLDDAETSRLIRAVGLLVDRDLLRFYNIAYLAFRAGRASLAADKSNAGAAAEAGSYVLELQLLLERSSAGTRHESLVS